jgi:hypothetical protein
MPQELSESLVKHNALSNNLKGNITGDHIAASTQQIWRLLKVRAGL